MGKKLLPLAMYFQWKKPKSRLFFGIEYRDHTCFYMHYLIFAVAQGSCLNPRPPGRGFKMLPRATVNVNALK